MRFRPPSWVPNALTVLRFLLVPVLVVLMLRSGDGPSAGAAAVFALAAATDQLDGWLARRMRVESRFGKYADPLADRLMIDAAVVMLALADRLSWAAVAVLLVRDAALVLGSPLALRRGRDVSVSALGKAATWMIFVAVLMLLLTEAGTTWPVVLFWIGVAAGLAAAADYVRALAARREPSA